MVLRRHLVSLPLHDLSHKNIPFYTVETIYLSECFSVEGDIFIGGNSPLPRYFLFSMLFQISICSAEMLIPKETIVGR